MLTVTEFLTHIAKLVYFSFGKGQAGSEHGLDLLQIVRSVVGAFSKHVVRLVCFSFDKGQAGSQRSLYRTVWTLIEFARSLIGALSKHNASPVYLSLVQPGTPTQHAVLSACHA